jgi:hypothetical protein
MIPLSKKRSTGSKARLDYAGLNSWLQLMIGQRRVSREAKGGGHDHAIEENPQSEK